jgi:hypothetical protein
VQQEINIQVGKKSPEEYIGLIRNQCEGGALVYGGIDSLDDFQANLDANCIPGNIHEMNIAHYQEFLAARRIAMAQKIKKYYQAL